MFQYRKITNDMYYIGANDRRISLFESAYPVPYGISYNSYFVDDKKTVVLDTVDKSVAKTYFENISALLKGRTLDYLIVNHMEPDHSAMIDELISKYPQVKIVCNQKSKGLILQFCHACYEDQFLIVNEGDILNTGSHTFSFYFAPMVHWPEVMVTYDSLDKVLYSADAFGTFGALSGNLFADETDFFNKGIDEARRYYTNIVGKYGPQVSALLKKAESLDISMICALHGPIFRKDLNKIIEKYLKWATYTPEDKEVVIAYASIYGNTENAAQILANLLAEKGIRVNMYDTSVTHYSEILSQCFRCSHVILAAPTYNGGLFTSMEQLLSEIKAHNLSGRTFGFIENGSWGPLAAKIMKETVSSLKNSTILEPTVTVKSSLKEIQLESLADLANNIAQSIKNS